MIHPHLDFARLPHAASVLRADGTVNLGAIPDSPTRGDIIKLPGDELRHRRLFKAKFGPRFRASGEAPSPMELASVGTVGAGGVIKADPSDWGPYVRPRVPLIASWGPFYNSDDQTQFADCYRTSGVRMWAHFEPADLFHYVQPLPDGNVRVFYPNGANGFTIDMALTIPAALDGDGGGRNPESFGAIMEKSWAWQKTGSGLYSSTNYGNTGQLWSALGRAWTYKTTTQAGCATWIVANIAAGIAQTISTNVNVTMPGLVGNHSYGVIGYRIDPPPSGAIWIILDNPWDSGQIELNEALLRANTNTCIWPLKWILPMPALLWDCPEQCLHSLTALLVRARTLIRAKSLTPPLPRTCPADPSFNQSVDLLQGSIDACNALLKR